MGTRCTCGQGHETFGACLRAKNIQISHCQSWKGFDATRTKKLKRELDEYAKARAQGIQPEGTRISQVRAALDQSDRDGVAFNATNDHVLRETL